MKNYQFDYINYASSFAEKNKIHIWLGGSFLNNKATPFSDIDISILCPYENLKDYIYGYGQPVYISHTSNPFGILIVIYKNGVAVDLEIVKDTIVYDSSYFHREDIKKINYTRDEISSGKLIFSNNESYQISRLFHRSIIKFLSGKKEVGISIFNEILSYMAYNNILDEEEYKISFLNIVDDFKCKYCITDDYYAILYQLAEKL